MVFLKLREQPPLVQAIFNGDPDEVRALIFKKEDVNFQDNEKRTPLHAAAYLGDAEIIELLILSALGIAFVLKWPSEKQLKLNMKDGI